MDELTGRTAVVTGAGSGMGRAFANRFAAAGMQVVLADIEQVALNDAVAEITGTGAKAVGVVMDAADEQANRELFDTTIDNFGAANVVCLNAGVGGGGPIRELTTRDWEWTLGVNLWGVIHGLQAFLNHLIDHGDGHVVITSSIFGHLSNAGTAPYNVAKHGVATLAETLHHELRDEGSTVGVTCLCPGMVNTRILDSERNRPEQLMNVNPRERTAEEEARREIAAEFFSQAKPPAEVADQVHDAILNNQFWLFTDEDFTPNINLRHDDIEQRRAPSPFGGLVDTE
ncbi:MAG: SDR family NAD(P)-dependent oxidoreductase [Actinomycetota bacterium]